MITFSKRAQQMFGFDKEIYTIDELLQGNYITLDSKSVIEKEMIPLFTKEGACEADIKCPKTNKYVHVYITAITKSSFKNSIVMGIMEDVTERVVNQEVLTQRAERDSLTKLLNRETFVERVELELKNEATSRSALFVMDVDDFKQINDKYGHYIGDLLLQKFAMTLTAIIDKKTSFVGRLGGDEFGLFVCDIPKSTMIGDIAQKWFVQSLALLLYQMILTIS